MKIFFLAICLAFSACSTTTILPENQQRHVAQAGFDKVELRELDELNWQMEIYQNGGPRTNQDLKAIRKSTASAKERAAMIRSLDCDPSTRTVSINPEQSWSTDPCFFSGVPQWNLFAWSRFNVRKVSTTAEQFRTMILTYDKTEFGTAEELYEVTLSDGRKAMILNTSFPMVPMFEKDREAAKKVVSRNGRVILLKQVNATQFKIDGVIMSYRFIPEIF